MTDDIKKYETIREKIRESKNITDLEKKNKLFNLWVDYIHKTANKVEQKNINHEHEKVKVRIQYI